MKPKLLPKLLPKRISEAFDFTRYERVIFLSPHLDDAVLSCGGLLSSFAPEVSRLVVTINSGNPLNIQNKMTKGRKGFAPSHIRRREDIAAMDMVDCDHLHLGFPDAIYRRHPETGKLIYRKYIAEDHRPEDAIHVDELFRTLRRVTHGLGKILLISPMGTGGHVDHLICMRLALRLASRDVSLLFYEDWPYVVRGPLDLLKLSPPPSPLLSEAGLRAPKAYYQPVDVDQKTTLIMKYESQVSLLFRDAAEIPELLSRRKINDMPCEIYWKFSQSHLK